MRIYVQTERKANRDLPFPSARGPKIAFFGPCWHVQSVCGPKIAFFGPCWHVMQRSVILILPQKPVRLKPPVLLPLHASVGVGASRPIFVPTPARFCRGRSTRAHQKGHFRPPVLKTPPKRVRRWEKRTSRPQNPGETCTAQAKQAFPSSKTRPNVYGGGKNGLAVLKTPAKRVRLRPNRHSRSQNPAQTCTEVGKTGLPSSKTRPNVYGGGKSGLPVLKTPAKRVRPRPNGPPVIKNPTNVYGRCRNIFMHAQKLLYLRKPQNLWHLFSILFPGR